MMVPYLLAAFSLFSVWAKDLQYERKEMRFSNGAKVEVELADSFEKRTQGLMHRTQMDQNKGMLFLFNQPARQSFWNKNTFIPLDLAYFDKNKKLKEVHALEPVSLLERVQKIKTYPSQCECQYVLEVNQGWMAKNKIKKGDSFSLHPL